MTSRSRLRVSVVLSSLVIKRVHAGNKLAFLLYWHASLCSVTDIPETHIELRQIPVRLCVGPGWRTQNEHRNWPMKQNRRSSFRGYILGGGDNCWISSLSPPLSLLISPSLPARVSPLRSFRPVRFSYSGTFFCFVDGSVYNIIKIELFRRRK
jgi:hypothetical protein